MAFKLSMRVHFVLCRPAEEKSRLGFHFKPTLVSEVVFTSSNSKCFVPIMRLKSFNYKCLITLIL